MGIRLLRSRLEVFLRRRRMGVHLLGVRLRLAGTLLLGQGRLHRL